MDDEELEDLPFGLQESDPLWYCEIYIPTGLDGSGIRGHVEAIEQTIVTKLRLYRVRFEDGDLQHFTRDQLQRHLVNDREEDERATEERSEVIGAEAGDEDGEVGSSLSAGQRPLGTAGGGKEADAHT